MSGDTFMEPKQGRSTGSKIFIFILLLGGGMLLLCCGGGYFMQRSAAPVNDPEKVRETAQEIATIEIPSYFKPNLCSNANFIAMKIKIASYELKEGIPLEVNDVKKEDANNKIEKGNKKKPDKKKKAGVPEAKGKAGKKKKNVLFKKKEKKKDVGKPAKTVTQNSDGVFELKWISTWGMGDMDAKDRREIADAQLGVISEIDFHMDIESSRSQEIVIRGTTVDVVFQKGTRRRTKKKVRSVEVVFPGKNNEGITVLYMQVPESLYNHDEIVKMLENIK